MTLLSVLSIRVMQSRNSHPQRFPSVESIQSWDDHGDYIQLSSQALLKNGKVILAGSQNRKRQKLSSSSSPLGDNGAVRVIFTTYNQLDQLLKPRNDSFFLNSKVISASLGKGRHIELPEPVQITFKHLVTLNVSNPICVYWDYLANSWSGDGCQVQFSNRYDRMMFFE